MSTTFDVTLVIFFSQKKKANKSWGKTDGVRNLRLSFSIYYTSFVTFSVLPFYVNLAKKRNLGSESQVKVSACFLAT